MKKMLAFSLLGILAAGLQSAEFDFTAGPEALADLKPAMRNIEVLPGGPDGGILAAEGGKFAAFSPRTKPDFSRSSGEIEMTVAPVVDSAFFRDAKKVQNLTLMEISWPDKSNWTVSAVCAPQYQILGIIVDGKPVNVGIGKWEKGSEHKIRIAWNESNMTVSVDGVQAVSAARKESAAPTVFYVCGYNNIYYSVRKLVFSSEKE